MEKSFLNNPIQYYYMEVYPDFFKKYKNEIVAYGERTSENLQGYHSQGKQITGWKSIFKEIRDKSYNRERAFFSKIGLEEKDLAYRRNSTSISKNDIKKIKQAMTGGLQGEDKSKIAFINAILNNNFFEEFKKGTSETVSIELIKKQIKKEIEQTIIDNYFSSSTHGSRTGEI